MGWKRTVTAAALIFCAFCVSAPHAGAVGFGFYIGGGVGDGDYTFDLDEYGLYSVDQDGTHYYNRDMLQDISMSTSAFSIGILLDTNVNRPGLFNYRMNLGYEKMDSEVDVSSELWTNNKTIDWNGVVLEQDFGFGGKVGEKVRIWAGPCIRLSYHSGEDDDRDYKVFGYGAGPVLGLNYTVSSAVAFTVRTGFLFNGYRGTIDTEDPILDSGDFEMSENRFFLHLGVLFGSFM